MINNLGAKRKSLRWIINDEHR